VVGGKGCVVGVVGGNRNKDKRTKGDKRKDKGRAIQATTSTHKAKIQNVFHERKN